TSDQARIYDMSICFAASPIDPVSASNANNSALPGPNAIFLPDTIRKRGSREDLDFINADYSSNATLNRSVRLWRAGEKASCFPARRSETLRNPQARCLRYTDAYFSSSLRIACNSFFRLASTFGNAGFIRFIASS